MSIVTLQLGQCGNQVGGQFFQRVVDDMTEKPPKLSKIHYENYVETSTERFFCKRDDGLLEAR